MATLTNVAARAITIDNGTVTERGSWITWKDDLYCGYRSSTRKSTVQFRAHLSEPCTSITLKVTPYGYGSTSSSVYYFKASDNEQDPVLELGAWNVTTTEYDVKNADTKRNYSTVTVTINGNFKAGYIYIYAWANNTNKWLAGDDDYPTKIMSATSATAYSLSISQGANSTIVVSRTSSNLASTGTLTNGAKLYSGDKLKITFSAATGYNLGTHTVNGSAFTSGGTHTVSKDVAIVSSAAIKTYTVSYDANGGTGAPSAQTKTYGKALTLISTKPTKGNTTANGYKVTFNANGGSCNTASLMSQKTTKYAFSKWNTEADGTGTSYNAGGSYEENADAKLYAQYTPTTTNGSITLPAATRADESITGFKVTLNANGGNCDVESLTSTRLAKFTFKGWATSPDATSGSTGSYTPTKDITLYAIWGISYIDNAITLPTPTRSGYTFKGWATSSSATAGATGSYTPTNAITLYAIWKVNGQSHIEDGNSFAGYGAYIDDNGESFKLYIGYVDMEDHWELLT